MIQLLCVTNAFIAANFIVVIFSCFYKLHRISVCLFEFLITNVIRSLFWWSKGKKWSFFGKFGVLCFLLTPVLTFALLPYYRRISVWWNIDLNPFLWQYTILYPLKTSENTFSDVFRWYRYGALAWNEPNEYRCQLHIGYYFYSCWCCFLILAFNMKLLQELNSDTKLTKIAKDFM